MYKYIEIYKHIYTYILSILRDFQVESQIYIYIYIYLIQLEIIDIII